MPGDDEASNVPEDAPPVPATVTPKLRAFNPEEPELWFANAEFQFDTACPQIRKSMTKFKFACMALSPEVQREVKDIFLNPPEDPYQALKERLCDVYRPSQVEIAARVLDAPLLGDSTASALASSMLQHLPTDQQRNLVIREAFLRHLPLDIRGVIEEDESLDIRRLAKAADRRLKGCTLPTMMGPLQIAMTTGARLKTKPAPDQRPPGPGTSRRKGPKTWCWLHRKFGAEARNCIGRCEWPNYPVAITEIQEN